MIETKTFAEAHGWQPQQVRQLIQDLSIPAKAAERSQEDWRRLEATLVQGPNCLTQDNLPPTSKLQSTATAFTPWDVSLSNGMKGREIIPGLDRSLVELEDGSRVWICTAGMEVKS